MGFALFHQTGERIKALIVWGIGWEEGHPSCAWGSHEVLGLNLELLSEKHASQDVTFSLLGSGVGAGFWGNPLWHSGEWGNT